MTKRIETKVSKTAEGTCWARAISYYEKSGCRKSDDYIAPLLIPTFWKWIACHDISRNLLKNRRLKLGLYEYIVGRTKLIDDIFRKYSETVQQVLIFGAGFDTRAIRFQRELRQATVFELDAPVTQNAKIHKYEQRNIVVPPNLKFVAIDFDKESPLQKLIAAGFEPSKPSLFLLEGLTYYLEPEAIDQTFKLIQEHAGDNSIVVFDCTHASVARQESFYRDAKIVKMAQSLKKIGEQPKFAVEGSLKEFLAKYDFELVDEFDSIKLAEQYFNSENLGVITKLFSVVLAKKMRVSINQGAFQESPVGPHKL